MTTECDVCEVTFTGPPVDYDYDFGTPLCAGCARRQREHAAYFAHEQGPRDWFSDEELAEMNYRPAR